MPTDRAGKFHGNIQRAMAADKNSAPPKRKVGLMPVEPDPLTEAPAASPAMDHLRDLHAESGGGKQILASRGEDGSITSHQIGESGEPEGPHTHSDVEELKAAMDEFFAEELAEPEMQQE